jgi:hypothetical protein
MGFFAYDTLNAPPWLVMQAQPFQCSVQGMHIMKKEA